MLEDNLLNELHDMWTSNLSYGGERPAYDWAQYVRHAAEVFEDALRRELDSSDLISGYSEAWPSQKYEHRDAPDLVISNSSGRQTLAVEAKLWRYSPKNTNNRINEALSLSVRYRREFKDRVSLALVAVLIPDADLDWRVEAREGYSRIARFSGLLRQSIHDAGFDRLVLGLAGPGGGWVEIGSGGVQQGPAALSAVVRSLAAEIAGPSDAPGPKTNRSTPRGPVDSRPRILLVADEWQSGAGGISTFNRELAASLASLDCLVHVVVPDANDSERDDATAKGVTLVVPDSIPGVAGKQLLLMKPRFEDEAYEPDVVIGHGRILGPYAYAIKNLYFPSACRIHFVHMDAEMLESAKEVPGGPSHMTIADERRELEVELAFSADLVAGVGPLLRDSIANSMRGMTGPLPEVLNFRPGLRDWGDQVDPEDIPPVRQILLIARADDIVSKGIDIAVQATANAVSELANQSGITPTLVIRGVPEGQQDEVKRRLEAISLPHLLVVLRPYSSDESSLRRDLWQSRLVLMPSRHEGFGLAAYEAISAGVPVLMGSSSGLAVMLREFVTDGDRRIPREILPVQAADDQVIDAWATSIKEVLVDPAASFHRAADLRAQVATAISWDDSSRALLRALGIDC
ncbi:glycosyltransferase family 4 protein [Blastococcus sp. SYSU DS0617]